MADPTTTAQAAAALRYDPQKDAINRRIQGVGATQAANEAALNQYGTTGRDVIGQVYNVLDTKLGENRTANNAAMQQGVQGIQQGYDQAAQASEAMREATRRYAEQQGMLGNHMQDAYAKTQADLETVLNRVYGSIGEHGARAVGNQKAWASNMDSIYGMGQNIGSQMRADAGSRFETSLLDALANNRLNAQKEETDLYGQLSSILGEQGNFLTTELARLAENEWERQFKQAQLAQAAQQANAELSLRSAAMADDRAFKQAQLGRDNTMTEKERLDYELRKRALGNDERQTEANMSAAEKQRMAAEKATRDGQLMDILGMLSSTDDPNQQAAILNQAISLGLLPQGSTARSVLGSSAPIPSGVTGPKTDWQPSTPLPSVFNGGTTAETVGANNPIMKLIGAARKWF